MSKPQEQVKVKIPLHLRLTYDDWKETFKSLTNAELGVFYSIRTLDPYGDRELEIDCTALGADLGLHRTSISRALESLSQKKLIDMEIVRVKVKQKVSNRRLTLLTKPENQSNNEQEEEKESCASTHTSVRPRTSNCTSAQGFAPAHTNERPRTNQAPKAATSKGFGSPQTLQTNTDIDQTLSDSDEREKFEKFCRRKMEQLPKMPTLPDRWIEKNLKSLYPQFKAEEAKRKEADEQIQASKEEPTEKAPPTAANLHKRWLIKGIIRKDAIAKALELGYVVTPQGISDPSEDPSEGNSSGGGGDGG